jgi:hypothetical protein
MAITSTRITVGTTTTLLVAPSVQPQRVQFINTGTQVVRIGGPDVTTTAFGLPRLPADLNAPRTVFSFQLNPGESIFGIVASGTSEVNVWVQTP